MFHIQTKTKRLLSDTFTPVSLYLKVRDQFSASVLLESTDFRSVENCFSFIGIDPIARFVAQGNTVTETFTDGSKKVVNVGNNAVLPLFKQFVTQFHVENTPSDPQGFNGFLGHTSYDAVQYFDTMTLDKSKRTMDLPDIHYALY